MAVLETSNAVLIDARTGRGGIAPGYYAASTNSLEGEISDGSQYCYQVVSNQRDGWTGDPDFADSLGYFDDTSRGIDGFPCHKDAILDVNGDTTGLSPPVFPNRWYPRFGHGAGMSQTGALRWAVGTKWNPGGKPYTDSTNTIERPFTGFASAGNIGDIIPNFTADHLKDWRQILMHYYVFPFVDHGSRPWEDARWYQLSVADFETNPSNPSKRIVLEAGEWEGTEVTILDGVFVQVGESSTDKLKLTRDESNRPSYLVCQGSADVLFMGEVVGEEEDAEATCTGTDSNNTASMKLNKGGTFKAAGACLQAGAFANVTIGAGETAGFESGGFLSNQGGTFTLNDNAILGITSTAGAPEVDPGSSFVLGNNAKIVLNRNAEFVGLPSKPVTITGGDITINSGHAKFWNTDFNTDEIIIQDGASASFYADSGNGILISSNFYARLGSTFEAKTSGSAAPPAPSEMSPGASLVIDHLSEEETDETASPETEEPARSDLAAETIRVESYPNPFNPTTTIRYQVEEDAEVTLKVFNLLGQEVKTLVDTFQRKGIWESHWDGRDSAGSLVASGTYFYQITMGGTPRTGTMVFIK